MDDAPVLAELGETDFAAVLTDIRLGAGLNGWDVARSARLEHPHMAVIYMTGDSVGDWVKEGADERSAAEAIRDGTDDNSRLQSAQSC